LVERSEVVGIRGGSWWLLAGVTFAGSDSASLPKFLNPNPKFAGSFKNFWIRIRNKPVESGSKNQIWEFDSCSDSCYQCSNRS